MLGALVYLQVTSFRNWTLVRLRRLRQPKYLAGAAVAAVYFWFFFFRPLGQAAAVGVGNGPLGDSAIAAAAAPLLPDEWLPVTTACGALMLLVFATMTWVVPRERAVLGFSEAEIAFLFPAPITRRGLVHFRLLTLQARTLLGAAVMMLFSHRWSALGGSALTHAAGWWFVFSALGLHFHGAGFTLTQMAARGVRVWPRRLAVLVIVVGAAGVSVALMPVELRDPWTGGDGLRPLAAWVATWADTAPLAWLLWPAKLLVGPFLATEAAGFWRALPPALAVLVLLYLWVVRSAVAFEEAAIDQAQARAARRDAWRSGRAVRSPTDEGRSAPFPLAETGWPEIALLWKNLLSAWPYFTGRVWLGTALAAAAATGWAATRAEWREPLAGIGVIALVLCAYVLVAGPQFARQDLRGDLANADVLKTYPLPGWRVVLGELLAPTAILTGICWLLLLVAALAVRPAGPAWEWLTPGMRGLLAVSVAAVVPLLAALQLLVPNAAALVFPAWFEATRTRGGGPEAIGQRMIFFFAQFLTMLAALLPGAVVVALAVVSARYFFGPWLAVPGAALGLMAVLADELALGLHWLGRRFEKLDLSAELRS